MTTLVELPPRITLTLLSEDGQRARHSICVPKMTPDAWITPAAMRYGAAVNQLADRMAVQSIQVERRRIRWNHAAREESARPAPHPAGDVQVIEPLQAVQVERQVIIKLSMQTRREAQRAFAVPLTTTIADCYGVGDYIATICQPYIPWIYSTITIQDNYVREPEPRAYPGARRAAFSVKTSFGRSAMVRVPGVSSTRGIQGAVVLNRNQPEVAIYIAVLSNGVRVDDGIVRYGGENGDVYTAVWKAYHETMGR